MCMNGNKLLSGNTNLVAWNNWNCSLLPHIHTLIIFLFWRNHCCASGAVGRIADFVQWVILDCDSELTICPSRIPSSCFFFLVSCSVVPSPGKPLYGLLCITSLVCSHVCLCKYQQLLIHLSALYQGKVSSLAWHFVSIQLLWEWMNKWTSQGERHSQISISYLTIQWAFTIGSHQWTKKWRILFLFLLEVQICRITILGFVGHNYMGTKWMKQYSGEGML